MLNNAPLQTTERWSSGNPPLEELCDHSRSRSHSNPRASQRCIRHFLVAVDFSPASFRATDEAVVLANQCGAELTVLHVIDINAHAEDEDAEMLMKRLWDEGSSQMAQLGLSLCGQAEARTMLEQGLAWESIIEKSKDYDLVVLGRGDAGKRHKLFSQRTVERVVQNASCPVMVVR